jgi:hypothetical protein
MWKTEANSFPDFLMHCKCTSIELPSYPHGVLLASREAVWSIFLHFSLVINIESRENVSKLCKQKFGAVLTA